MDPIIKEALRKRAEQAILNDPRDFGHLSASTLQAIREHDTYGLPRHDRLERSLSYFWHTVYLLIVGWLVMPAVEWWCSW